MNRTERRALERAKRRIASRPKHDTRIVANALDVAIEGAQPLDVEQRNRLQIPTQAAVDAIAEGRGTVDHSARMSAAMQIIEALVEQLANRPRLDASQRELHAEVLRRIRLATEVIAAIEARTDGMPPFAATAHEAQLLHECVALHLDVLRLAPLQMIERAVHIANARARTRHGDLLGEPA